MRILHVSWEYPPLVYGGLGRHVGALSVAQAALGHEVTVITQGEGAHDLDGVRVVRVASTPFSYELPELLTWVGELDHRMGLAGAVVAADVVHAHDWMVGRAGVAVADASQVPLVATIHATEAGRHSGWLPDVVSASVHLVEQWLVDEADAVIVCSRSMARELRAAHGCASAHVIPNGITLTDYWRTDTVRAALLTGSPRLAFVGRVEWEKGVFVAVDAMPAILAAFPAARLRIVGTGGQSAAVAEQVARMGLGGRVTLLGHVDEPTLREVYSSSDLLLAPSSYEPFGIVALEAAAMGVPLIVGETGGLAEFVTEQRGRRCPPGDASAVAQAVIAALDDVEGTARRARAARDALADYTWERIAEQTVAVYEATTPGPRPARQVRVPSRRLW